TMSWRTFLRRFDKRGRRAAFSRPKLEHLESRLAPAVVLTVDDICVGAIDLSWTGSANNRYDVARSSDGINFATIATLPAVQTTFVDTGLANGTYFYQVTGVTILPSGTVTDPSNVVNAILGPIQINHFVSPDNPGFTDHSDMSANGSAQFTADVLRLNNN